MLGSFLTCKVIQPIFHCHYFLEENSHYFLEENNSNFLEENIGSEILVKSLCSPKSYMYFSKQGSPR